MSSYCDLELLKLAMGNSDTADDVLLQLNLDAATAWIDEYCGRRFVATDAATKIFTARDPSVLSVPDLRSVTSVAIDTDDNGTYATTLATSDYELLPLDPFPDAIYTAIRLVGTSTKAFVPGFRVRVVGNWGYVVGAALDPPAVVQQACLLQAQRLAKRREAPLGIVQAADLTSFARVGKLDPDVAALLAPYRRSVAAAWIVV